MSEIIIILIIAGCIAWVVWAVREHRQVVENVALDHAWREVLNDPHYTERRHYEERKRVVDKARADAANRVQHV